MPLNFKDKRLKRPSSKTQKSGVAGKTSLSSCPDLQHEPALGAWWPGLQGRTSTLVQVRTSSGLVHLRQLRDWSLITGRGGGLQNRKIAGLKLFAIPTPSRQGKTCCAPPLFFLKSGKLVSPPPPPPSIQYG